VAGTAAIEGECMICLDAVLATGSLQAAPANSGGLQGLCNADLAPRGQS